MSANDETTLPHAPAVAAMTRRSTLGLIGTALAALLVPSTALRAAPRKSADQLAAEQAVNRALETFEKGFRTRDSKLMTLPDIYFADDSSEDHYVCFDVVPPFVDVGVKTLYEKYERYFAATDGPTIATWSDRHVDASGSLAFFRGILHSKGKFKDGRVLDAAVRHTLVFKKINGKYLIVHEHASVPDAAIGIETPPKQA